MMAKEDKTNKREGTSLNAGLTLLHWHLHARAPQPATRESHPPQVTPFYKGEREREREEGEKRWGRERGEGGVPWIARRQRHSHSRRGMFGLDFLSNWDQY